MASSATPSAAQGGGSHTLQTGETLYAVARQYNISVKDLQEHNNISGPNMIHAGTVLRIPGRAVARSGPVWAQTSYWAGSPPSYQNCPSRCVE